MEQAIKIGIWEIGDEAFLVVASTESFQEADTRGQGLEYVEVDDLFYLDGVACPQERGDGEALLWAELA